MIGIQFYLHNDAKRPYMIRLVFRGKLYQFLLIDRALLFTLVLR